MKIELLEYPNEKDWMEIKRRALVTVGKKPVNAPDNEWKRKILYARHSLMCAANVTTGRTPTTAVPRGRMRRWQ